jgi:cytochrome c oxidase assembly protein subunit 15
MADVLALGFGSSVAMWSVAYVCNIPAFVGSIPRWAGVLLMLLVLLGGCFLAGKLTGRGWLGGLWTGLVSAVLNLLVLAGLWKELAANAAGPSPIVWLLGYLALSAVIGVLGGASGRTRRDTRRADPAWVNAFAWVTLAAAALLIAKGGVVTSIGNQAALSVPDWPTSFGSNMFLFPLGQMLGNVYFEHAHRLFGALVGLTTLALALLLNFSRGTALARSLSVAAVAMVILQGYLGGLRVEDKSTELAIAHGILAQLFIGLLGALTVITAPLWQSARTKLYAAANTDKLVGLVTLAVLLVQLCVGALLRHLNMTGMLHLHITVGCIAFGLVLATGLRAWGPHPELTPLRRSGMGLIHMVSTQFLLGFAAWGSGVLGVPADSVPSSVWQVILPTLHQTVGALLLAWTIRVVTLNYRLLRQDKAA